MDTKTEELVISFLETELAEGQANRLARHLETHAADREEFLALAGQARVMAALFSPAPGFSASVLSGIHAAKNGGRFVGRVLARVPRRSHRRRRVVALAAAAAVLLAVGVAVWLGGRDKAPSPTVALAGGWRLQPTGAAVYRVVTPDRVRLDRGELLVESVELAGPGATRAALRIETPAGTATAAGTSFYIGTHQIPKGAAMKTTRITRVLVLSGVVTLAGPHGSVAGGANELLVAEGDQAPAKHAIQANSDFAFDLYAQFAKENAGKNMFFSPYSISSALAMTAEGARGQTAEEMGKVLRFPAAARRVGDDAQLIPWKTALIHTGMAELNDRLTGKDDTPELKKIRQEIDTLKPKLADANKRAAELLEQNKWGEYNKAQSKANQIASRLNELLPQVDQYELRIANALWGEQTYPFLDAYIDTISKHYKTGGVFPADFVTNYPAERVRINKWIEQQTNDRIKDLIPKLRPDEASLVRLILTNAIYFKGEWSVPFDEANTKPREFTLAAGGKIDTATMSARYLDVARYGAFNADGSPFDTPAKLQPGQRTGLYPGEDGFAMLELAYKGDDLSMVLLAPNAADGLAAIEAKLTGANLAAWVAKGQKRDTHVLLPRFKLETDYKMAKTLQAMGMVRAFVDPGLANGADFTGMCASADPTKRLYISKVLHKAFVEVNEKGTEAAAATAVMAVETAAPPRTVPFTPTFRADRPFLFVIRDVKTGSIIFMGRMMNPKQ